MDLFSLFYEPLRRASAASSNSARLRAAGKAKAQEAEQDAAGSEVDYLDPEGGLAVCWLQAIHQRLEASSTGEYGSEGALEELDEEERLTHLLEANTWALLQSLYLQRTSPGSSGPSGSTDPSSSSSSGDSFTYTPPLTLVQNAIAKDSALGELSIVKDWLCETAYTLGTGVHPAEVRKGYQPYTKNKLKQAIRTSTSGKGKATTGSELVTSLDPDATNRTDGSDSKRQVLDSEDANYEKALLRTLWEYVRVGELDQAIDMCRQSDVSWRAASLSGGKLYEDDVLARAAASAGGDMEILQSEGEERFIQGNLRRKLWKTTCRALAGSEHLDQYEKALYGAIAGEQESVLPVCRSWEDQLWVRINALLEEEIDSILLEKEQQGNYLLDEANSDAAFTPSSAAKGKGTRRDIPKAMQDIFNALLAEPTLRIDARSPFHVAQSWIILDRTNDLLDSFVSKLEASSGELDEPQLAHLLRFFAHLILFLRLISQTSAATIEPLPTASSTAILEAYIQVLQAHSQSADVIAFYCSSLEEDGAIEAYARYLFSEYTLSTNATSSTGRSSRLGERQERRQALLHAADNGLHLASVARRVVELTLADVYTELPDFDAANAAFGLLSPSGAKETGDEREQELIRSVEWLTFDAETYPDALRQANALMRYFLCAGSPLLARRITFQIPPDLLPSSAQSGTRDPSAPHADAAEDQINEYLDYTSFFSCLSLHLQYTEIWSRRPVGPQAKQSERLAFSQAIKGVTGRLWEEIVDLLTTGWLVLALPEEAALDLDVQRRQLELSRIRAAYVPELVFRLHNALLDTGKEFVPSNLQRCLELSNVVADERHRLYTEFLGVGHSAKHSDNRLREYLDGVREAALCALQSSSDPFQVVEA